MPTSHHATLLQVALQHGDMKEYNQCQTQVALLHHPPASLGTPKARAEFAAYRILYQPVVVLYSSSSPL